MPSNWTYERMQNVHNELFELQMGLSSHKMTSTARFDYLAVKHNSIVASVDKLREELNQRDKITNALSQARLTEDLCHHVTAYNEKFAEEGVYRIASQKFQTHADETGTDLSILQLHQMSNDVVQKFLEYRPPAVRYFTADELANDKYKYLAMQVIALEDRIAVDSAYNNLLDSYAHVQFRLLKQAQTTHGRETLQRFDVVEDQIREHRQLQLEGKAQVDKLQADIGQLTAHTEKNNVTLTALIQQLSRLENFSGMDEVGSETIRPCPALVPTDAAKNDDDEFYDAQEYIDSSPKSSARSLSSQLVTLTMTLSCLQKTIDGLRVDVRECRDKNIELDRRVRTVELAAGSRVGAQDAGPSMALARMVHADPFARFEAERGRRQVERTSRIGPTAERKYLPYGKFETSDIT